MNIAIDISPLSTGHKVRGVGFYLKHLQHALLTYYSENSYTFFTKSTDIPKNIDVVHYPYFDPFFLSLPFRKHYPTVVTVHDLTPLVFPKQFPAGLKGTLRWRLQRLVLKNVNAIITDSEASKNDIVRIVGIASKKIHVAYLAAGEEFVQLHNKEQKIKEIQKKYNLPEKFALYVGDITPNKNVPRIIQACQEENIPLVLVGKALAQENFDIHNSWNRDLTQAKALLANKKNTFVLGFVADKDIVALYNSATMVVLPSLYEGFGLPSVEAMQCGCPVVTSDKGSLQEVVGEAAYIVDPNNLSSMKEGFQKVFSDQSLQKDLQKKGFKQAAKFSWKTTAKQTLAVYESILRK